jgi:hypothetical protein
VAALYTMDSDTISNMAHSVGALQQKNAGCRPGIPVNEPRP